MNNTIESLTSTIDNTKEQVKTISIDGNLNDMKNDISKAANTAIDKAANYIIKAMPVPDAIKDILKDVKDAMKTRDLKKIVSTAVTSSIREGLEILGCDKNTIKDVFKLKDIAMKGGLSQALKNGIEIVANNYLKNNIVGQYVYDFFNKLKNYILTNRFGEKINELLEKLQKRKDKFFEKCGSWYNAYSEMDLDAINTIANSLNRKKEITSQYLECAKENQIIQNMTKMVNSKNSKLTDNQLQLCRTL